MKSDSKKAKYFTTVASISYGLILLFVFFFRGLSRPFPWTDLSYAEYLKVMQNLVPFWSVYLLLSTPVISRQLVKHFAVNFLGHIILFIPWGLLLPLRFEKFRSFKCFVELSLLTFVLIEYAQLFTMLGIFDVEDILLNLTGACIGFAVYRRIPHVGSYQNIGESQRNEGWEA